MTMHRSRILALAAAAALIVSGPAWAAASIPEGSATSAGEVLERGVTSNRLVTARMWSELHDVTQALRADAAAENWDTALARVREVRTRIDALAASRVVDHQARLLISELRPFAVSLEQRIVNHRTGGVLRGVDTLLAHLQRTQNELLAAGHMERLGGGAGRGVAPREPAVQVYPPGMEPQTVPREPELETPEEAPNRSVQPGNERNTIDEWREPID